MTVLGIIARIPGAGSDQKLLEVEEASFPILEAYRTLRTNLLVSSIDKPIETLIVTSPVPRDGKSTTVANLGVIMAQAGKSVILVDADLRRSSLHKIFQLPNRGGLTDVLLQGEPMLDGWLQETGVDNLRLLASGPLPPNPPELLGSQKMRRLFENLTQEADMVIFDTPPMLAVTDATVLAMMADGVLVITDAEKTRRGAIQETVENLRQAGANILGAVLNRVSLRGGEYSYYRYDYGRAEQSVGADWWTVCGGWAGNQRIPSFAMDGKRRSQTGQQEPIRKTTNLLRSAARPERRSTVLYPTEVETLAPAGQELLQRQMSSLAEP